MSQIKNFDNVLGTMYGSFTKDSSFDAIRFGVNGSQIDTVVWYNVSDLENGKTYTISWRVLNTTQGSMSFDHIQLQLGSVATAYEPFFNDEILIKNKNNVFDGFLKSESGSNDYGSWTKFSDGTMICIGIVTADANVSVKQVIFPMHFATVPLIVIQNIYYYSRSIIWSIGYEGTAGFDAYPFETQTNAVPTNWSRGRYIAIGRWK